MEHATGLTRLHLGPEAGGWSWENSNDISDLSPLSGLTSLTWLNLSGNPVSDLTPLSRLTGLSSLNLQGCPIFDESLSPLASLTGLTDLWLAGTGVRDAASLSGLAGLTVHGISWPPRPPPKYPKLDGELNRFVEAYEAALEAGRVTSMGGRGPCLDPYEFPNDFRIWDPSDTWPAFSLYVVVRVRESEDVDRVTCYLKDNGVPSDDYDAYHSDIYACVPVPLLGPLSELPGVGRVEVVLGSEPDSPTLLEGASWGAIKDRFK